MKLALLEPMSMPSAERIQTIVVPNEKIFHTPRLPRGQNASPS